MDPLVDLDLQVTAIHQFGSGKFKSRAIIRMNFTRTKELRQVLGNDHPVQQPGVFEGHIFGLLDIGPFWVRVCQVQLLLTFKSHQKVIVAPPEGLVTSNRLLGKTPTKVRPARAKVSQSI